MTTENDRVRRRLFEKAKQFATAYLRERHSADFSRLLLSIRYEDPDLPRSTSYRRAEQALRKAHESEYRAMFTVEQHVLHAEHGYEHAPWGGHHTGANAKPKGDPRRVDSDVHLREDAS